MARRRMCIYCLKHFDLNYLSRHLKNCKSQGDLQVSISKFPTLESDEDEQETRMEIPMDCMEDLSDENYNGEDGEHIPNDDERSRVAEIVEEMVDEEEMDGLLHDFQVEIPSLPAAISPQTTWMFSLMSWLCLFLALWQYTFSITDTALEHLIKFLKAFFMVLGQRSSEATVLAAMMPPSLYMLFKHIGCNKIEFRKYVVCTSCYKLYKLEDCIETVQGIPYSKLCSNVLYPNHPQKQHRRPCGQLLMMKFVTASGKTLLYPLKTYCYLPVQKSLELLVSRKGFMDSCEVWRKRESIDGIYSDIYDGKIWKEFADPSGIDFFSKSHNYGLMLNLDWFCPYKHVKSYSVGVLYAVVTNLPRSERFKRENLLLIGIIPSMKKEPKTNTFLEPLVDELITAWHQGFNYNVSFSTHNPVNIHLAMILVGCDIPACRKLCGFLGKLSIYYFKFFKKKKKTCRHKHILKV